MIERFVKDKFDIRAQKPVMKNVVHVVRDFDDPIPPDVSNLDMITFFFAYHDITYMQVDRAGHEQEDAGGAEARRLPDYRRSFRQSRATASASPRRCTGSRRASCGRRSRRPASSWSRKANFLRHPEDPREAAVFRPQVPNDEFVLKYQKPM